MIAKINAMMPSTPRDTPSPIPALIPTDIPLSFGGITSVEDVEEGAVFEEEPDGDRTDGDGVDVDGTDAAVAVPEESVVVASGELRAVVGTSRGALNPTTAMAPTLDAADMVVVVMVQSLGDR